MLPLPCGWTTASKTLATFPKFPKLPAELRIRIYNHALNRPRTVTFNVRNVGRAESEFGRGMPVIRWKVRSDKLNPALLFLIKETREETLKIYHLLDFSHLSNYSFSYSQYKFGVPIYFNPEQDTFAFDNAMLFKHFARAKFAGIQSLAIHFDQPMFQYCRCGVLVHGNSFFNLRHNIEKMLVVVRRRAAPEHMQCYFESQEHRDMLKSKVENDPKLKTIPPSFTVELESFPYVGSLLPLMPIP